MDESKKEIGDYDTDSCTAAFSSFVNKTEPIECCIAGSIRRPHTNYKDIDEMIIFGYDGKSCTMKEIVDFDDEKFDRFYQHFLQLLNENPIATTQTQILFALQIVMNKRENKRLREKLDSLLKS
uniref:Uncharacterized protein n=1 Tax=Marseillevirus LCMAC101 TaxID=2506602 RepID=A0A481YSQ2_9VIRU|nr:MAG: hypothetical protein LCMAC101_01010 [Marseillevirus LCMAC101]